MSIEAMKLALEALERYAPQHGNPDDMSDAITALRTAIEQAEKQEPVAWRWRSEGYSDWPKWSVSVKLPWPAWQDGKAQRRGVECEPLYTTPPAAQRQWVGLTDTQIEQVYFEVVKKHRGAPMPWGQVQFGKALEAKLKDKNT